MKNRIITILVMVLPMILLGTTWLDRLIPDNSNSLSFGGNRSWRILSRTISEAVDGEWEENQKFNYHYNNVHTSDVDSLTVQTYDYEFGEWADVSVIRNTYLPGGEYLESGVMEVSMMGMTFELYKTLAVYDSQQRLTHLYTYSQPFMAKEWAPEQRIHLVYSGNQYTVYTWTTDLNRLAEFSKINFTWDTQGRVISETEQTSPDSLSWTNSSRSSYTWHPNDTTTGAAYISYISHEMPKMLMMMDDGGFIPGMVSQLLDEDWAGAWVNSGKDVYTYNSNDTINDKIYYNYMDSDWNQEEKQTYAYDVNSNISMRDDFYRDMDTWFPYQRTTYNWGQSTSAWDDYVPNPEILAMSVYPVPFRDALNISLAGKAGSQVEIEIFNLRGQLIHKTLSSPNSVYSWDDVQPAGVYFIKASQDGHSSIRKAIKIK